MLHEYETVIIMRPDMDDPATLAIVEKLEGVLTGQEGTILLRDDWGKRKLAYPVEKHQKGHYVLVNYLAQAETVAELERRIRIEDSIVRFLTVKLADAVDVPTRIEQAAEQRRRREEEARVRREQEAREAAENEGRDRDRDRDRGHGHGADRDLDDDDEPAYS